MADACYSSSENYEIIFINRYLVTTKCLLIIW